MPYLKLFYISVLFFSLFAFSCKQEKKIEPNPPTIELEKPIQEVDSLSNAITKKPDLDYDTSQWMELTEDDGFITDIRYASSQNFTKKQIYDCGRCFVRPELGKKMKVLKDDILHKYQFKLKFFDCYRPRSAQKKLWDIVPDARFVAPPSKGSMHSKGLAVDVTIVDKDGNELDMGTPYDFFGKEAYPGNLEMPKKVINNRQILLKLMEAHGLTGIRTEWWHFSLKTGTGALDNWEWEC